MKGRIHYSIAVLSTIVFSVMMSVWMPVWMCAAIGCTLLLFFSILFLGVRFFEKIRIWMLLPCIPLGIFLGWKIMRFVRQHNLDDGRRWEKPFAAVGAVVCFYLFLCLLILVIELVKKIKNDTKAFLLSLPTILSFHWFWFLFLPCVTMLENSDDFMLSFIYLFLIAFAVFLAVSVVLLLVFGSLNFKVTKILTALLLGGEICAYVQYMFFNRHMPALNGAVFDFRYYPVETAIDALVWVGIFASVLFLAVKKEDMFRKVRLGAAVFLFLVPLTAFVFALFAAPDTAYHIKDYEIDNSGQFIVSFGENIILFVFDGVDNKFVKTLLEEEPEAFDGLEDFTMYTNTCSVYDRTNDSLPQMLSGGGFETSIADYDAFYGLLHGKGYQVHFYNYEYSISGGAGLEPYIDNYTLVTKSAGDKLFSVDYPGLIKNMNLLTAYQTLPNLVKGIVPANRINFTNLVSHGAGEDAVYDNQEFYGCLELKQDEECGHYFIMQHLLGAHYPADYLESTKECLDIVRKTITQLKECGLYEDAAIIITADHGVHDDTVPGEYPSAGTPVFMIHQPGERHDGMQFSSAPIYHTDLLGTVAELAGISDGDTKRLFGTSVFDFKEGDERERTWANSGGSKKYCLYTYTGLTEDLERAVDEDRYVESY